MRTLNLQTGNILQRVRPLNKILINKILYVAFNHLLPCPNGHTLCSNCKNKVHNCCPTCRRDLGDIRCLDLEEVAESLEVPCKYQNLGCHDIFPYYGKLKHEQHCWFRPYKCPYAASDCSVTGDIPTLVAHLKDDHKVDMHDGCFFNHRYVKSNPHEVESATWIAYSKRFSYSLEVSASGRKLIWQGIPRSIRDSSRKVRESLDGPVIQRNLALFFLVVIDES
ncbi:hypothetical protein GOBAR_AA14064 [Gossypium barbadense]|uniref:RING-type E3 ubiquitin transferase n=1 Tax=Gossypium barbadense TaxID=3634 RepID=A0A2P5XTE7_GOSBA|nr:hypothetical protein GOBAR_AA14064 [Gossypium barbadense]